MSEKGYATVTLTGYILKLKHQSVFINSGIWKRRKITTPPSLQLRPTMGHVRETIFSWIRERIPTSRCIDLYAGTGILGLEALSQGAAWVNFVEINTSLTKHIEQTLDQLNCLQAKVWTQSAKSFIDQVDWQSIEIVFLDPPYDTGEIIKIIHQLSQSPLKNRTLIVMEWSKNESITFPSDWNVLKIKTTKRLHFGVIEKR